MAEQQKQLTEKQKQVLDMLEAGAEVPAIAKKMKVTPSSVYNHIRNIRKAGYTIPAETIAEAPNGAAPPAEPESAPASYQSPLTSFVIDGQGGSDRNGTTPLDPEAALREAITSIDSRRAEIETEISALTVSIEGLRQETELLSTRRGKYDAALSALA